MEVDETLEFVEVQLAEVEVHGHEKADSKYVVDINPSREEIEQILYLPIVKALIVELVAQIIPYQHNCLYQLGEESQYHLHKYEANAVLLLGSRHQVEKDDSVEGECDDMYDAEDE